MLNTWQDAGINRRSIVARQPADGFRCLARALPSAWRNIHELPALLPNTEHLEPTISWYYLFNSLDSLQFKYFAVRCKLLRLEVNTAASTSVELQLLSQNPSHASAHASALKHQSLTVCTPQALHMFHFTKKGALSSPFALTHQGLAFCSTNTYLLSTQKRGFACGRDICEAQKHFKQNIILRKVFSVWLQGTKLLCRATRRAENKLQLQFQGISSVVQEAAVSTCNFLNCLRYLLQIL